MFDVSKDEMLGGSLLRSLVVLSIPLVVQNLVVVLQTVIDLFWLGRLSESAVAAVGIATPVIGFVSAIVLFTPYVGTQVLVAQYVGDDDQETARQVTFNGLALCVVLGVFGGAIGYVSAGPLVRLVASFSTEHVEAGVVSLSVTYIRIISLGLVFGALSDVCEAAYIGRGDSTASLYINATAVAVNLLLNPLLIFDLAVTPWPGFGIVGAGVATVVGYATGFVASLVFVLRGRAGGIISRESAILDVGLLRELVDVGVPIAVQNGAKESIYLVLTVVVVVAGGGAGIVAYTIGGRMSSLSAVPLRALQQAIQTLVGQNVGASKFDRATKATWTAVAVATCIMIALAAVQLSIPAAFGRFFSPQLDGEALRLTVTYLQILALSFPAAGALHVLRGSLSGAGETRITLYSSVVEKWMLRLPLSVIAVFYFGAGIVTVFWITTVSKVVATVCTAGYYLLGDVDGSRTETPEPS